MRRPRWGLCAVANMKRGPDGKPRRRCSQRRALRKARAGHGIKTTEPWGCPRARGCRQWRAQNGNAGAGSSRQIAKRAIIDLEKGEDREEALDERLEAVIVRLGDTTAHDCAHNCGPYDEVWMTPRMTRLPEPNAITLQRVSARPGEPDVFRRRRAPRISKASSLQFRGRT